MDPMTFRHFFRPIFQPIIWTFWTPFKYVLSLNFAIFLILQNKIALIKYFLKSNLRVSKYLAKQVSAYLSVEVSLVSNTTLHCRFLSRFFIRKSWFRIHKFNYFSLPFFSFSLSHFIVVYIFSKLLILGK